MMTNHFDINRPVHLARRDVFFERAAEILYSPLQHLPTAQRIERVEMILALLKISERHAFFAIQASKALPREHDMLRFLRLIYDSVQSAHSMMQHQLHLEAEESFLCQFLTATPEQCVLPALHYQRRAEDILQGLWNVLQLAHTAYRALQQANQGQFQADEQERYRLAYDSFRQDVMAFSAPPAPTPPPPA
ncbi:MAG: hypothetical protein KKC51_10000 [Verrucomicrobia bacterium]|nr:hypothetical protein [Verrucomicrobiota bacterium]